jgi:carbohydrate-binding DOMON domain-containing protein
MLAVIGEKLNLGPIKTLVGRVVNVNGRDYEVISVIEDSDEGIQWICIYMFSDKMIKISLSNGIVDEIAFTETENGPYEFVYLTSF